MEELKMKYECDLPNTYFNPKKAELKNIRATIDFDSTINDMGRNLGTYIAKFLGVPEHECRSKPDGYERFHFDHPDYTDEEISFIVQKFVLEESPSLLPTPFAIEVLTYCWICTGQPITVITYRPFDAAQVTWDWLNENLPKCVPFNLIMLQGMQKDVVLGRLGTKVYVDDRYKTANILRNVVDISVLYRRPWNQGRKFAAGDMTIHDLRGLIPIINFLTGTHIMDWPGNIPYPNRLGYEIGAKYA
jgi:hypothetical protein